MTEIIIVPGWMNSEEGHWQSLWQEKYHATRVEQRDWQYPQPQEWIDALQKTILQCEAAPILVAHSLGCNTVIEWSKQFDEKIKGALLVAPTDLASENTPEEIKTFPLISTHHLAFPSIVVSSENDPFVSLEKAQEYAEKWGSQFINAGQKGHIGMMAGFGHWPEGEEYLKKLL